MKNVIKRNGTIVQFDEEKIKKAITSAYKSLSKEPNLELINKITHQIEELNKDISVEEIQDLVVKKLMNSSDKDVAMSYQSYRTLKEDLRNKEQGIYKRITNLVNANDKSILNENANKDSKTISVQRDLLAGISSKEFYLNKVLPKHLAEAHIKGEIHIHDLDYLIFQITNCLGRETEFVTSKGVKSFFDFEGGEEIEVLTPYGNWKKAIVKKYNKRSLNKITFSKNGKKFSVRATSNHRWLLKGNIVTNDIKIGEYLYKPNTNMDLLDAFTLDKNLTKYFCHGFCLGDGSTIKNNNKKIIGTRLRLCGTKNKFLSLFLNNGFRIQKVFENGDNLINSKEDLKTLPNVENWSVEEIQAYIFGYLEADAKKDRNKKTKYNSIYIKDENVQKFIRKYLPIAQIFSISNRSYEGQESNFGKRNGKPIEFNLTSYPKTNGRYESATSWKIINIEKDVASEIVWCLEVEDDHSFVLKNGITTMNCENIFLEQMLKGGCKIGNALMSEPNSVEVAVGHTVQIIASVSSNTFGGCTVPYLDKVLVPYIKKSFKKHYLNGLKYISGINKPELELIEHDNEECQRKYPKAYKYACELTEESVKQAMQGLEYEINSLSTVNG